MPPFVASSESTESTFSPLYQWQPYEFKWIEHLGSHMIERVRFTAGGIILQEFTGDYMYNLVERDFTNTKKELYYKMTGHVTEMNDPSNAYGRQINIRMQCMQEQTEYIPTLLMRNYIIN